jgi:hypothetical protein
MKQFPAQLSVLTEDPIELTEVISVNYKAFIISQDNDEELMPVDEFIRLNSDRIL